MYRSTFGYAITELPIVRGKTSALRDQEGRVKDENSQRKVFVGLEYTARSEQTENKTSNVSELTDLHSVSQMLYNIKELTQLLTITV
ncbi:hypothetical protein chiPu_0000114 [Chiloscyllium punctatum]|uniref:Uncharacterized protein n=1 Tax=Chiloscyllium punctatum TaxID=137246 RepID=A0A401RS31_CHIPU|nr:hypothetical protein [Chiloscyllium punctatum]